MYVYFPMAFKRVKGGDTGFKTFDISSITVAAGDVLDFDRSNAVVVLGTSSSTTETLSAVSVESATTADTEVLCQLISENDEYVVDTTNNSNASHNYQRMVLTDEDQVNNTGTDSTADEAVFLQLGIVGAVGDKKIRGRFITTTIGA